jgi:hypothetical protein
MLLLATMAAIAWCVWRGASLPGIALMSAGLLVHLALTLRLVRASTGGVGGHAEWVRERSARPRLERSPAWVVGLVLILLGLLIALGEPVIGAP